MGATADSSVEPQRRHTRPHRRPASLAMLKGVTFAAAMLSRCSGVKATGVDAANHSTICVTTEEAITALLVNEDQATNGVEGNTLVVNDCSELVAAGVMNYRSDEDQKALCDNLCYATLNAKYKTLLDNDCFAEAAGGDADEAASARLQAAAYQFACQMYEDGKYCVPLLGKLVEDAGAPFDLCDDIVSKLGCCFQSYRQYMLLGTAVSIAVLDEAQATCTSDGVGGLDQRCPCGSNFAYNIHAFIDTTFCSGVPSQLRRATSRVSSQAIALAIMSGTWFLA